MTDSGPPLKKPSRAAKAKPSLKAGSKYGDSPAKVSVSKMGTDKGKGLQKAQKLQAMIEAKHQNTDDELFEKIKVKPENVDKKTHLLDKEQQEARMVLMHRLLIRKVAPAEIQKQLGVTPEMYYYLRPKLDAAMRLDISKLDVPYMIGDTLALYDEIRSMALMMASSTTTKDSRVKLQALGIALKSESDKNGFLVSCGVYAPQIVEHLIRGMVSTGATLLLSGETRDRTKSVEDMVGELLDTLQGTASPVIDDPWGFEGVQLSAKPGADA